MAIKGCLLNTSAGLTAQDLTSATVLSWDTEVYDTDGFHTGSGSKIIIPSSVSGRGIFTGMVATANVGSGSIFPRIIKNGSFVYTGAVGAGRPISGNGQSTTSNWTQINSGPLLLTAGDEWELDIRISSDTSVDVTTASSFGLYVYGQAHATIGCIAQLNAAQAGQNFQTPAAISFDGTDILDTNTIHDPSGAPTKFTIPSAANGLYGIVHSTAQASSVTNAAGHSLAIRRTRSGTPSLTYAGFGGNSTVNASFGFAFMPSAQTQVHQFTTGDEYEALLWVDDASVTLEKTHANAGTPSLTKMSMVVYG